MEKLADYLNAEKAKGFLKKDFAKDLGITAIYLSAIIKGRRNPSFDLMLKIESKTNGYVALKDWVPYPE